MHNLMSKMEQPVAPHNYKEQPVAPKHCRGYDINSYLCNSFYEVKIIPEVNI